MRQRCPLPIGQSMSMMRVEKPLVPFSRLNLALRVERRQVVEQDLVAGDLGRLAVDLVDLEQREVRLALLRRADRSAHAVAGAQVEAADLRRRDVDVVRAGQVVVVGGPQEAEAVGQTLEHAVAEDGLVLGRVRLEQREDQLLFAEPGRAFDVEPLRHLDELGHRLLLQFAQVHREKLRGKRPSRGVHAWGRSCLSGGLETIQLGGSVRLVDCSNPSMSPCGGRRTRSPMYLCGPKARGSFGRFARTALGLVRICDGSVCLGKRALPGPSSLASHSGFASRITELHPSPSAEAREDCIKRVLRVNQPYSQKRRLLPLLPARRASDGESQAPWVLS